MDGFEFCKNKCTRMHWSVQEGDVKSRNNCDFGFTYAWDFGSISFHFFAHITKATPVAERSVENCVYGTEPKPQNYFAVLLWLCYDSW